MGKYKGGYRQVQGLVLASKGKYRGGVGKYRLGTGKYMVRYKQVQVSIGVDIGKFRGYSKYRGRDR